MSFVLQAQSDVARRQLIRERLGSPEYTAFFRAVRARLEAAGGDTARSVALRGLSEAERRAVADLHGWRTVPEERVRVSLAKLDALLRQSAVGAGVIDVVEAIGGPLADRRAEREAARGREEHVWVEAAGHPGLQSHPNLLRWLDGLRARGIVNRVARASCVEPGLLLHQALDVVARLPASGVPLSVLAAETTGDAHALDPGRPVAVLVLRAAARLAGWPAVPAGSAARRRLWAEVGVLCDPLSAQVLVLGLRPAGDDDLSRQLCESAEAGEPRRLTLRELARSSVAIAPGTAVFVCENPVVVAAAADRIGRRCASLVCVEGVPSTAALQLLRRLEQAGGVLSFHADFDWAGLRIGNLLRALVAARPWRFTAADYRAAQEALAAEPVPLKGAAVRASWDAELDTAMRAAGRAVFEEQVIDALLEDLAQGAAEAGTHLVEM